MSHWRVVTLEGCQYYLFKYVLIEGYYSDHDYFALNPYIIYKGKNPQLVEDIGKLFYFDEQSTTNFKRQLGFI